MILDHRTYQLRPDSLSAFLELYGQEGLKKASPLLVSMENKILRPAPFFALD